MSSNRTDIRDRTCRDLSFDLTERVKELECLYGISQILDRLDIASDGAYINVLNLARAAFQRPEDTGVQLTMQNRIYRTDNFSPEGPYLASLIRARGEAIGSLQERFLGPSSFKPPFLKEERKLLKEIAGRLATTAIRLSMAVQLKNSEKFYRSLFQNASEGIFLHYTDGHIGMANKAMARISGYSNKELLQMHVNELLSYDEKQITPHRSKASSVRETRTARLSTKSRHTRYVEVSESKLGTAEKVAVTQTIIRDVSLERQRTESAHAYAGQVISAQENERMRIARELHDDTIQALLSLGMDIDAVLKMERSLPETAASRLERLRDRTKKIGDSMKTLIRDLRPPMLDEVGLLTAIRWLSSEGVKGKNIESRFEVEGQARRLSPEAELTVFRIAQEALNNVVKHSGASQVVVSLSFGANGVRLSVADNGRGFDASSRGSRQMAGKMGLTGMEERARLLGGKLAITSDEGMTTVSVDAPM